MITARLEEKPVLKAVVTKPYQGKGYAEGYEVGHAQGYTEGEQTAQAAAEAANAVILADCNEVLPTKGASTAETLEQVPQRIGEIEIVQDNAQYANVLRFTNTAFPNGYEMQLKLINPLQLPQFQGSTGIRKLTLDVPTDKAHDASNMLYGAKSIEEVVLPDGIKFSKANYFATLVTTLVSVFGRLDVTGVDNENIFQGCSNLVDVSFVPLSITHKKNIGSSSKLSAESIQSIIDGLADLTGKTAQTLTLHATVGAKLTEAQKATITAKNWTLVY